MTAFSFPGAAGFRQRLTQLFEAPDSVAPQAVWLDTIQRVLEGLGGSRTQAQPFVQAWRSFYTATLLLDHLQDGDLLAPAWFATQPPAVQYQLAFSAYADAQHTLGLIDVADLPPERLVRLHAFWFASVLQIAEGQYHDLTQTATTLLAAGQSPLHAYEAIIAQKTGAIFALAFGGAAMLATDDQMQIAAAVESGTLFGMLLQYSDDLTDAQPQAGQSAAMTLQRALLAEHRGDAAPSAATTWIYIYAAYVRALDIVLAPLPAPAREAITMLIEGTFGPCPVAAAEALARADRQHHGQ